MENKLNLDIFLLNINNPVKRFRKYLKMTQVETATLLGTYQEKISRLETCESLSYNQMAFILPLVKRITGYDKRIILLEDRFAIWGYVDGDIVQK